MDYKYYDEKYAKLLVRKCFVNDGLKPLIILFDGKELESFAQVCYIEAKKSGFKKVFLFDKKRDQIDDYIRNTSLDNIRQNELLDRSLLENIAKENGNVLYLETFKERKIDNIDKEKRHKVNSIIDNQLSVFYENIENLKCPWCVACYPNKEWASKIYPNLSIEAAYEKLYLNIMKMCMVDKEYPEKEWDSIHKRYSEISEKLNDLKIKRLHYTNNLGTDLKLYLPDNHIWIGADDRDYFGNSIIVNMPGYEIFTAPIYSETEGIIYSSKPLYYEKIIDLFALHFKNGEVKKIVTKTPEDYNILKEIVDTDEGSKSLGEVAIVEEDTPVGKTNTLYYETLYDENASCHLALGSAHQDSIDGGLLMTNKELKKNGLNVSDVHIDFMVGTSDLKIEADTKKGKKLIYTKGKFTI